MDSYSLEFAPAKKKPFARFLFPLNEICICLMKKRSDSLNNLLGLGHLQENARNHFRRMKHQQIINSLH